MVEKEKTGWNVPAPLMDEFRRLAKATGNGKQHWALASAGVLALLEMPETVRAQFVNEIISAELPGRSYAKAIARAKSGEIRREAEAEAPVPAKPSRNRVIGVINPR